MPARRTPAPRRRVDEGSWMTANPGQIWASVDHGGFRGQPTPRKKKNFKVIINIIRINSHCGFRAPPLPAAPVVRPILCCAGCASPLCRLCRPSVPAVPPLCAACAATLCRLCRPSAPAVPPAVPAVPPAVPAVPPAAPAVPPRCAGCAIFPRQLWSPAAPVPLPVPASVIEMKII